VAEANNLSAKSRLALRPGTLIIPPAPARPLCSPARTERNLRPSAVASRSIAETGGVSRRRHRRRRVVRITYKVKAPADTLLLDRRTVSTTTVAEDQELENRLSSNRIAPGAKA